MTSGAGGYSIGEFGTLLVLPGVLIYVWDFFGLSGAPAPERL